jgi:Serine/threonine protein phosphatase
MYQIFAETDIGKVRDQNQDAYLYGAVQSSAEAVYAIVCDGMGGHKGGNRASSIVSGIVAETLSSWTKDMLAKSFLSLALTNANHAVLSAAKDGGADTKGMGSTAVAALVADRVAHIAHVGDSRAYLWETDKNKLTQLTKDHSYVQALVDKGEIDIEQATEHPQKHRITRAVGAAEDIVLDYNICVLEDNAALLLCTDGLTGMLPDDEILAICKKHEKNLSALPNALINAANEKGGTDNITALIVSNN